MHRIDTKTAQKDKFGAGKNGFTTIFPAITWCFVTQSVAIHQIGNSILTSCMSGCSAKGISLLLCDPLSERRHQRRWCVVKIFNYGAKPHRLMAYLSDKHCLIRWCCNAEFLHRRINMRKPARSQFGANTSRLLK